MLGGQPVFPVTSEEEELDDAWKVQEDIVGRHLRATLDGKGNYPQGFRASAPGGRLVLGKTLW